MNQLGIPYVRGSATSMGAAVSQTKAHGMDELRVLQHIGKLGAHGATDDEVEQALDMLHQTASARRRTLVLRDQLVDSGVTRKTRSNRPAVVWVVPQFKPPALALGDQKRKAPTKAELKAFVKDVDASFDFAGREHVDPIEAARRRIAKGETVCVVPPPRKESARAPGYVIGDDGSAAFEPVELSVRDILNGVKNRPVDMQPAPMADETVKHLMDGLFRRPAGSDLPDSAVKTGSKPRKKKRPKSSGKKSSPTWIGSDGKARRSMPKGAYLRMRTEDEMVWLTECRPTKGQPGDFDSSLKVYGPFKTADEQRAFMRNAWTSTCKPGPQLDAALRVVDEWVRYDEKKRKKVSR